MGSHIDQRKSRKQKYPERDESARRQRASFKQYLREIEEEELAQFDEIDDDLEHPEEE